MMSELETVRYEITDGVGWITLARPEVMNAFDERMLDECAAPFVTYVSRSLPLK